MDLIEIRPEQLYVGMLLRYTLRDEAGKVLLIKGQRIEAQGQLDAFKSRKNIFVELDANEEGVRAMMSGISALDQAGAPIKDFSKYLNVRKITPQEEKNAGTLVQRWGDVESKLGGLLASIDTAEDFESRIDAIDQTIASLLSQDETAGQFLLFNRSITHFGGYSVLHSLLCACLSHSLARVFVLSEAHRRSLVCAALTMNVSMRNLQDQLALQKSEPTVHQRRDIEQHAQASRALLIKAGVRDALWLDVVAMHHDNLDEASDFNSWLPAQRLSKILQTTDRYSAAMSPRKSRSGRTARDSVRTVVLKAGSTKHDEVGSALVKLLGLCPPGTYVKLSNGETAVVVQRGIKPAEPLVASVLNKSDAPIAEPRLREMAREGLTIASTLVATSVRVNLNLESMLRMIPRTAN
jgi:HD-GYP domain-containing protein (c-di-GMP phosphodiesterase class II)